MAHGDVAAVDYAGRKCLALDVALAEPLDKKSDASWINIARVGQWKGHAAGEFEFTRKTFQQLVENGLKRKTPVNVDYEHESRNRELGGPKASAGWIQRLELRAGGDELWALVRWTSKAAEMIRGGEYRTCSPVVAFDSRDRATDKDIGPELLSLALTNDPFLDGLHPIQLTRTAAMADADSKPKEDDKPKDDAAAADSGESEKDKETREMADGADGETTIDAAAFVDALSQATGQSADAALGILFDKIDAVAKIVTDNAGDGTVADGKPMTRTAATGTGRLAVELTNLRKENKALTSRIVALTDRLDTADKQAKVEAARAAADAESQRIAAITARVKGMVADMTILATEEEGAIFMFANKPELAEKMYADRKPLVGTLQAGNGDPPRQGTESVTLDGLTEREKRTVKMMAQAGIKQDRALKVIGEQRAAGKVG